MSKNVDLNFIRKSFSSNNIVENMIEEIMEIRGASSRSQVIRDALFEYRRSTRPAYVEPSPTQKLKLQKIADEERLKNMPDEQWATEIFQGVVLTARDGKKWVVHHTQGNNFLVTPLDQIRDKVLVDEWFKMFNLQQNAAGNSLLTMIHEPYGKALLLRNYDIEVEKPYYANEDD